MNSNEHVPTQLDPNRLAKLTGIAFLAMIVGGIASAMLIAPGIDINMSADISETAENMLGAETRLHAKAYSGLALFGLEALISIGLYFLLRTKGPVLALWCLIAGLAAAMLTLLGSVFDMNAAQIAGNDAFNTLTDKSGRQLLTGLQATSDYTSFHLGMVLTSVANAGFFWLFLKSGLIPKLIAGFGLFASLFVAVTIVARDFIPALGANAITFAFMICNLIAMISLALYLVIKGVREV